MLCVLVYRGQAMGLKLKEIQTSQGTASLLLKVSIAMLRLLGSVPSVMDSVFWSSRPSQGHLVYRRPGKTGHSDPFRNSNKGHLIAAFQEVWVKWALGSIIMNKVSGGDGIPVGLFQTLKGNVVKVLHSICQQIWKTQNGHRTGKDQFLFQSQRKVCQRMFKIPQNCTHFTC